MGLRNWAAFLWRYAADVDWRAYWPRVLVCTATCALSDIAAALDWVLHSRDVAAQPLHPEPVFVLGIYRSGTTLLQNYIAQCDPAYTYIDMAALHPHGFLSTTHSPTLLGRTVRAAVGALMPSTRVQDNVVMGPDSPLEDEAGLFNMGVTRPIPYMMLTVLPRLAATAGAAARPQGRADAAEAAHCDSTLLHLLRKVTFCDARARGGAPPRPLALKSPMHTARVERLLRLFPRAKFVHIQREPLAHWKVGSGMPHACRLAHRRASARPSCAPQQCSWLHALLAPRVDRRPPPAAPPHSRLPTFSTSTPPPGGCRRSPATR